MTTVLVFCSQVSAAIGKNKYKKPWEVLLEMWQRVNPDSYEDAMVRNGAISSDDAVREVILETGIQLPSKTHTLQEVHQNLAHVEERIDQHVVRLNQTRKEKEQRIQVLRDNGADEALVKQSEDDVRVIDLSLAKCEIARKETTSQVKTQFGQHQEEKVVSEKSMGTIVSNNDKFYKLELGEVGELCNDGNEDEDEDAGQRPIKWGIGGRIDGFRKGVLVEIKNRVNRLFDPLPEYDIIQIQCYMQILNTDCAIVIQKLGDKTKETYVRRDRYQWENEILPGLTKFIQGLFKVLNNTDIQDALLSTPDKQRTKYLNSLSG